MYFPLQTPLQATPEKNGFVRVLLADWVWLPVSNELLAGSSTRLATVSSSMAKAAIIMLWAGCMQAEIH